MKTLLIDPRNSGIGGEMLIAALADLTGTAAPVYSLAAAITGLPGCSGFDVSIKEADDGIRAKKLSIKITEDGGGPEVDPASAMEEVIAAVGLSAGAAMTARAALTDLIRAERRLHPSGFSHHATTTAGTIFEILGPLLLMENAGLEGCPVQATPPALGGNPAPAALEICVMHKIPVSESRSSMELTTPAGAALLANLADIADRFPAMTPLCTGYGAGRSNPLRIVGGEVCDLVNERIVILETNLDDVTGELLGYTFERLFAAGAVDVFVTPAIGKKNRPVQVLSVITDHTGYQDLIRVLMDETGTLGVRVREEPRLVADRSRKAVEVSVTGQTFPVRVKTSRSGGRVVTVKPEYEDMKEIALALCIPLRQVAAEVQRQIPGIRGE